MELAVWKKGEAFPRFVGDVNRSLKNDEAFPDEDVEGSSIVEGAASELVFQSTLP